MGKPRGQPKKLNEAQEKKIIDLLLHGSKTQEEIAAEYNISEDTVYRLKNRTGLVGVEAPTPETPTSAKRKIKKPDISKTDGANNIFVKRSLIRQEFMETERYKHKKTIYSGVNLDYYVDQWVSWIMQLKDITPSEEDSIDMVIMVKMRLEDNQREYDDYTAKLAELKVQLLALDMTIDTADVNQRILNEQIQSISFLRVELNKDTDKLMDKFNALQKGLNVSREQREKNQKIGGPTFLKLVKEMTDKHRRDEISEEEEYFRLSTLNKVEKMKVPIMFEDGMADPIILDGSDFANKRDAEGSDDTEKGNEEE